MAPVFGRLAGWLLICEPPQQTIDEIAAALHASRSAISGGVAILEKQSWIVRTRAVGERADRIAMNPRTWDASLESPEFSELAALANEGLDALRGSPSAANRAAARDGGVRRVPARSDARAGGRMGRAPRCTARCPASSQMVQLQQPTIEKSRIRMEPKRRRRRPEDDLKVCNAGAGFQQGQYRHGCDGP